MPLPIDPEWQRTALYAAGAALALFLLFSLPFVGRIFRGLFSLAMMALVLFLLLQQAPYEPTLARLTERLGLGGQAVAGDTVRIGMAADGHFWADVAIGPLRRRMLIDSGATITALSQRTADAAGIPRRRSLAPVILRTANGAVPAEVGTAAQLRIGAITARNLAVVISPALGETDVIGMNFLSRLESWRVEGRTLILVPARPDGGGPALQTGGRSPSPADG